MRMQQRPSASDSNEEIPEAFLSNQALAHVPSPPATTSPKTKPPSQPRTRRNLNPSPPSTSTYYFDQGANGTPIFLHPLDIRIPLARYGSYTSFPESITVLVEASDEGIVDDDLRKRCKYLGHRSEGANVVFVKADLRNVVSDKGLKGFEWALRIRRSKREEKARKDDKARIRAEEREKEKLNAQRSELDTLRYFAILHRNHARTRGRFAILCCRGDA